MHFKKLLPISRSMRPGCKMRSQIPNHLILIFFLVTALMNPSLNGTAQTVRLIKLDSLQQRLQNGKDTFYIVNYWATWCAPCIKELPYFNKLQKEQSGNPVKVLLVSVDFLSDYEKSVIPFVQKQHLDTEVFLLNEKNQQEYIDKIDKTWSGALPATAFINRKNNTHAFFEQEFTYESLFKIFKSLQK